MKMIINYFGMFSDMWFTLYLGHMCSLMKSTYICLIIDFDNTESHLFILCLYDVHSLESMKYKYLLVGITYIELCEHIALNIN